MQELLSLGAVLEQHFRAIPQAQSCVGAILGELQPVGGPYRISGGKMASVGGTHMEQGKGVTMEDSRDGSLWAAYSPILLCHSEGESVQCEDVLVCF